MDRLEKDIQKRLDNYEVEPPAELWSSIENRLDEKAYARAGIRRKRMTAVAAAALLFLLSASALLLNQLGVPVEPIAQETTPTTSQPAAPEAPDSQSSSTEATAAVSSTDTQRELPITTSTFTPQKSQALVALKENKEQPGTLDFREQPMIADVAIRSALPSFSAETASLVAENHELAAAQIQLPGNLEAAGKEEISNRMDFALANADQAGNSSFSLATFFAPQQSYRYQNRNTPNPMQALESEIMTFAAGLHVNYKVNNRWEIQSGLGYNRMGQRVNDIATFSHPSMMALYSKDGASINEHPQSMSTSMGGIVFTDQSLYFADISSSRIITLKGSYDESIVNLLNKTGTGLIQHFEYLEMPVNARYKFWQKGFDIYAKAGLSANYLLSANVFLPEQIQSTPIGTVVGINKLNFSGMAGLAISYPVTNRVSLNLEPTASMFLTPMGNVRNLTRETHPYSWSVLMGVSYSL